MSFWVRCASWAQRVQGDLSDFGCRSHSLSPVRRSGGVFPLWDSKRQTVADKIKSTVVAQVAKQPLSFTPQG